MTEFVRKALVVLALVALALFLWQIAQALLLAFGGVLFAVLLVTLEGKLREWSGLGHAWALGLVLAALAALVVGTAMWVGPQVAAQLGELGDTLRTGVQQARDWLAQWPWGTQLAESAAQAWQANGSGLFGMAAEILLGFADALLGLVLVFFAGVYFAAHPRLYTDGFVRLIPLARQPRARQVLHAVGDTLGLWLLGQLVSMVLVGTLTTAALYLVGVPLAGALGLITGLLEFIPFLGPIAAFVPVLIVAGTAGTDTLLYAGLAFLGVQQVESHLITPLVQRWAVRLPPVLVIVGAIAFALVFGLLGALLATPLLVVAMVCTKMLYMHDALGEKVELPNRRR